MNPLMEPLRNSPFIKAIETIKYELSAAIIRYPPMASPHEGYAIILEELDELWEEIRKKPSIRSKAKMENEARQVAAMAVRFMVDICSEEGEKNE